MIRKASPILCFLTNIFVITRFRIREVNFEEMYYVIKRDLESDQVSYLDFVGNVTDASPSKEVYEYLIQSAEDIKSMTLSEFNEQLSLKYFNTIKAICSEILCLIQAKQYDQAYRLLDLFHNTPASIALNEGWRPLSFWLQEVRIYRKTFNCSGFLRKEQQELVGRIFGFK